MAAEADIINLSMVWGSEAGLYHTNGPSDLVSEMFVPNLNMDPGVQCGLHVYLLLLTVIAIVKQQRLLTL